MSNLLIRIFIKDYNNVENNFVRQKYGELGGLVGILSNIILFVVKIFVGASVNSVAIMGDAFNNLSDSLSSIVMFIGFRLGSKPADDEHPFGHGRIEYIASFVVSFIILMISTEFFKTSIQKIISPQQIIFNYQVILILIFTILIKFWQASFNKKLGELINSKALIATSIDSRNDVLVTCVTIISLTISGLFNINLDGYLGVIVSVFLMVSGFGLARETLSPLIGESIDHDLEKKIRYIVMSHAGIIGVHDIAVHNYGPNKSIASLHVEISSDMNVKTCHDLVDYVEETIKSELGMIFTIHIDPVDLNDKRIHNFIPFVLDIVKKHNDYILTSNYRIVEGNVISNFIFDMTLPESISNKEKALILSEIEDKVKSIDKSYRCIINIE